MLEKTSSRNMGKKSASKGKIIAKGVACLLSTSSGASLSSLSSMASTSPDSLLSILKEYPSFVVDEGGMVFLRDRLGMECSSDMETVLQVLFPLGLRKSDLWGSYTGAESDLCMLNYKGKCVEVNDIFFWIPEKKRVSADLFKKGREALSGKTS